MKKSITATCFSIKTTFIVKASLYHKIVKSGKENFAMKYVESEYDQKRAIIVYKCL